LEKIGFSLNKLEEINPSIFSDLTKLKLINFQSNEIKALNQNIFNRLKNLCEIDFSLETIHPEAFVNFISLEVIDLNDNKLKNSKSGEIRVIKLEENSNDKKVEHHVKSPNETKSK
jgi:hypothetical protein